MCYEIFTCLFLLLFGAAHLLPTDVEEDKLQDGYIPCEKGWFLYGEKCYKIFGKESRNLNWNSAKDHCISLGGHLATVDSKEIRDFLLVFLLMDVDRSSWIGLNDKENETHYVWEDGTPYEYSAWNANEPSGRKNEIEDCVEMVLRVPVGEQGEWNDNDCRRDSAYICQVDKGKQGQISPDPLVCPSGDGVGRKYRHSCYNIISESMIWDDAEKYCQDHYNGHLVMILDEMADYFLEYIMQNISSDIWIGIKLTDQYQQQYSSGWYVAFTNWGSSPHVLVEGSCVKRSKDKVWSTAPCTDKYPFICEITTDRPPVLNNPGKNYKCPKNPSKLLEDWRDLGGEFCYFIDNKNHLDWTEANSKCIQRGGYLASFHSKEELDVLAPFTETLRFAGELERRFYIGLYRPEYNERTFVWADGSRTDFTYWDERQPDNTKEKCGELLPRKMVWNDVNCRERKGYICSARKIHYTTNGNDTANRRGDGVSTLKDVHENEVLTSTMTAEIEYDQAHLLPTDVQDNRIPDGYIPCEKGWYLYGGKCYKIFGKDSRMLSWNSARDHCINFGGHLATVDSKEVLDFLVTFLLMDVDRSSWIGLNDKENETHYIWEDGTPYKYSAWNMNEPSELKDEKEDCVEMVLRVPVGEQGEWNDNDCTIDSAYICQVDKGKQGQMSPDPLVCPPADGGGRKYRNSCYNIISESMIWDDAEKYCQDHYKGHLVMVLDEMAEYFVEYIMQNFSSDIWIGIKMKDQYQQQYSSGWYAAYTNWRESLRDLVEGFCVKRSKDKVWDTVPCTDKYPFICEFTTVSPPVLNNPGKDYKCPNVPNYLLEDWRDLGGEFCYFIDNKNQLNWSQANSECIKRGGYLASFHSKEELDVLAPFTESLRFVGTLRRRFYIGLYRPKYNERIFTWADGSPMDFANWDDRQPDNIMEKCGELLPRTMVWNDVNCAQEKGYICSARKIFDITNGNEAGMRKGDDGSSLKDVPENENFTSTVATDYHRQDPQTFKTIAIVGIVAAVVLLAVILLSVAIYHWKSTKGKRSKKSLFAESLRTFESSNSTKRSKVSINKSNVLYNHPQCVYVDDAYMG